ncbi:membrane or secreted protein [marine sediment metagenome]|uniref:Membrane or secreted protein n=1 Tax=marine sediment metagenome TaxID=412755 RepID=A0A1B6NTD8_9ZZZZ
MKKKNSMNLMTSLVLTIGCQVPTTMLLTTTRYLMT